MLDNEASPCTATGSKMCSAATERRLSMIRWTIAVTALIWTTPAFPQVQNDDSLIGNFVAALDLTNAGKPSSDADVVRIAPGISTSFCPVLACVYTPRDSTVGTPSFGDHQRTSALFQARTRDDGHSEEQNVAVITTISTGYIKPYAADSAYAVGDNIVVGNAVYRAVTSGRTGSKSPPPGRRPTAGQGGDYMVTDGTVRWRWINDAAIDAKVGAYIETNVVSGAGAAWGAAFNYHIRTQPNQGNFFPGVEMNYVNESGVPCTLGITDCTALRLALGGSPVTEGMQVTGNDVGSYSAIWGIRLNGDKLASQSAIEVDAAAPVGLGFGVSGIGGQSHAIATIKDVTNSPTSLSILGVHSTAAILDRSKSRQGVALLGTYEAAQIDGRNFTVYPDGSLRVGPSLRVSPEQPYQATLSYDVKKDWTYVQSTHLTTRTPLVLNPEGGLVAAGPGGFSETLRTPASSSAPCRKGQFTDDADFHYVCIENNRWRRSPLADF